MEHAPTPQIHPKKRIRQGDPLSFYIFTLIMQNITILINERVKRKQINTFKKHNIMRISHLVYADDLIIFCKAKIETFKSIDKVFKIFEGRTGLRVSEKKSEVFFSNSTKGKDQLLSHLIKIE